MLQYIFIRAYMTKDDLIKITLLVHTNIFIKLFQLINKRANICGVKLEIYLKYVLYKKLLQNKNATHIGTYCIMSISPYKKSSLSFMLKVTSYTEFF